MQSRRVARTRSTVNENGDENRTVATTRLTRAKAASLSTKEATTLTTKTALAPKQSTAGAAAAPANRKRSALGDVSNVHKIEAAGGDKKAVTKKVVAKATTATKTTTRTRAAPAKVAAPVTKTERKVATSEVVRTKKRPAPSTVKEEDEEDIENNDPVVAKKLSAVTEEEDVKPQVKDRSRATKRPKTDSIAAEIQGWDDLDEEDESDPLMVSEYVNEIFEYLKKLEPDTMPNPQYMDDQEDLKWQMRGILIDWLVEVHIRFRLLPETLFLAVNIVDRFLSNKVVLLDKLQLVGVTAMFIAAKYEEVFSPHVQYFRHVADDGFEEEEILRAERFILSTLDYNLSYPNPMNFLRRISKADAYDLDSRTLAKYMMEISLVDHRFLKFPPSQVAAAAMYFSRKILNRGEWDVNLIHYSDYTEAEIMPVFKLMIDYLVRPVKHHAFYKKYASKKFHKASLHARQWAKRNAAEYGVELTTVDIYDGEDDE